MALLDQCLELRTTSTHLQVDVALRLHWGCQMLFPCVCASLHYWLALCKRMYTNVWTQTMLEALVDACMPLFALMKAMYTQPWENLQQMLLQRF